MSLSALLTDIKAAWATTLATVGTGTATVVQWIPDGIGKLGTLVGIVLSIVLIYTHLRRGAADHEKTMLEIAALKELAALRSRSRESRDEPKD